MVEISDSLCSLFTAKIKEEDGTFVIEIPSSEIKHGALTGDEMYRIALLDSSSEAESTSPQAPRHPASQGSTSHDSSGPPVDEGEVRDVTIETVGDQGDGIAKVETWVRRDRSWRSPRRRTNSRNRTSSGERRVCEHRR